MRHHPRREDRSQLVGVRHAADCQARERHLGVLGGPQVQRVNFALLQLLPGGGAAAHRHQAQVLRYRQAMLVQLGARHHQVAGGHADHADALAFEVSPGLDRTVGAHCDVVDRRGQVVVDEAHRHRCFLGGIGDHQRRLAQSEQQGLVGQLRHHDRAAAGEAGELKVNAFLGKKPQLLAVEQVAVLRTDRGWNCQNDFFGGLGG